jgi:hypothetical protein
VAEKCPRHKICLRAPCSSVTLLIRKLVQFLTLNRTVAFLSSLRHYRHYKYKDYKYKDKPVDKRSASDLAIFQQYNFASFSKAIIARIRVFSNTLDIRKYNFLR